MRGAWSVALCSARVKNYKMVRDFRKLDVWKGSFELVKMVYDTVLKFPKYEDWGLSSQLRRAVVSISSNIAEGCGRRTDKDFVNFLHMSMGSVREVECQLMIAKELDYLSDDEFNKLIVKLNEVGGKLSRFIDYVLSLR